MNTLTRKTNIKSEALKNTKQHLTTKTHVQIFLDSKKKPYVANILQDIFILF